MRILRGQPTSMPLSKRTLVKLARWYRLRALKRYELLFHTHTSVESGKLLGYFFWPEHLEFFSCTQF